MTERSLEKNIKKRTIVSIIVSALLYFTLKIAEIETLYPKFTKFNDE